MKILGVRIRISGQEYVEKNTVYVFMANHLSFLDGPLLFWLIPRQIRVILKQEIFRIPVIGQSMRHVRFVPVDRKGRMAGRRSIESASRLIKERGYSFLIFPEGTRSRDGNPRAFKRGGFFLAVMSGVPIVPMTIRGTYEIMSKGKFFVKKGNVDVVFHPPVPTGDWNIDDLSGLVDKVRKIIVDNHGTVPPDAERAGKESPFCPLEEADERAEEQNGV